jgi:hypothetical protein
MKTFLEIFAHLISFYYYSFDRIVIRGYLFSLYHCSSIIYFFKELHGIKEITKQVFVNRTKQYQEWVETYAKNNAIAIQWAEEGIRKEDYVKRYQNKMLRAGKTGVYFIFKSMEQEYSFRSIKPRYPTNDPHYHIIKKTRMRFTHYYFYIIDPILGPMVMRIATFLPFTATYYLNGHSYIEARLKENNIHFTKHDNAITSIEDPSILQTFADELSYNIIKKRLDYWTFTLGPKFSTKEKKAMKLQRFYSICQIEYCLNFIFKRSIPLRKIFLRACDIGLIRMTADKISRIFGQRITKRLRGKLFTIIDKFDQSFHVFRTYFKNSFLKQYQKFNTLLRNELVCNNLKDFFLKKSLASLDNVKNTFKDILDRFTDFQAISLNNHFDFDILSLLSKPIRIAHTTIPGIRIDNKRLLRIMEIFLNPFYAINPWKSKDLHRALLNAFSLSPSSYTLDQLRYDIRKLKAHGIIQRIAGTYLYELTDFGKKVCILFVLFHSRIFGPMSSSLFNSLPDPSYLPSTKIENAYAKIDHSLHELLQLLAA